MLSTKYFRKVNELNEKQKSSKKELSQMKECGKDIKEFANNLKPEIEKFLDKSLGVFEPIGYIIKEKGNNIVSYAIKIRIEDQIYIHVNISENAQREIKIERVYLDKKLFDELLC